MRKTKTVIGAEVQSAKPSARRYYVWQVAMWIVILHAVFIGWIPCVVLLYSPDVLACLVWASLMLSPVSIVACSRSSKKGGNAWRLLVVYWLAEGAPLGHAAYLALSDSLTFVETLSGGVRRHSYSYFDLDRLAISLLLGLLVFLPLFITLLAALLTIERKKLPPASEAGT
jgi:energy-coupling factor transporter transmembrane protein EcfT